MSILVRTLSILSLVAVLAACNQDKASTATTIEPVAEPEPTGPQVVASDVMAEPLTAESVNVAMEALAKPAMDPASGQLHVTVKVTNNGQRILSGMGKYPVNLGVQIVGDDGTVSSPGGLSDFVRAPLPEIAPGSSGNVEVMIPVDPRLDGRAINLDLVQEGVTWFSTGFGQPVLTLGPYKVCGTSLCETSGAAL